MKAGLTGAEKLSALAMAARSLAERGRRESAIAILSGHAPDSMDVDFLHLRNSLTRTRGVSVVMATYQGAERIGRALQSLISQTIDRSRFEIIVVQNGPEDGTEQIIETFRRDHPDLNITSTRSHPAGAGIARNFGCSLAAFDHITFLDDDDILSPEFLESLLELADGKSVVFSQIMDFDKQGEYDSPVNQKLLEAFSARQRIKPADAPGAGTALTMTCIKLFPSYIPEVVSFDPELPNGEDVVFWTEALARFDPDLVLCPQERRAVYYREVRENSISRQNLSFKFNVMDRIEVAKRIGNIYEKYPTDFVKSKALAAAYFMSAYLREHPLEYDLVLNTIDKNEIIPDVKSYINKSLSKTLAVSFCFPPWGDTAGTVAAKRLLSAGRPFDVISNDMSKFRARDDSLKGIAHHLIGDHVELKVQTHSTIDTKGIVEFSRQAVFHAKSLHKRRKYENLYSRAMWPASHFAAAAIKTSIPKIFWTAEFSDPMVTDILSEKRPGKIDIAWLSETGIDTEITRKNYPILESDSLMEWCEYIPYILADEIIFTNENQREYMLSQPWISSIRHRIMGKTKISPHPVLPQKYYSLAGDNWRPRRGGINIAYFGSFYKTRGLSGILEAISRLDEDMKREIRLDIYAAPNADLEDTIRSLGISTNVEQKDPLPYFRFLSRCKTYDFLLVNDAETRGIKRLNPYLPSKVSDYLGAGIPIWAVAEAGSPLYRTPLPEGSIISELGNTRSYAEALGRMTEKRLALTG